MLQRVREPDEPSVGRLSDKGQTRHVAARAASVAMVGDWVEIRSAEEILSTLDDKGELDNLPFMPEMLRFCEQRFRVFKSAHKSRPGRWLYDRFQHSRGGLPFPARKGKIPMGKALARDDLDLQPGEWVRIKSFEAILATLDTAGANRYLNFADEMVPYCGGVYRVRARVDRFIDEATGYMRDMKTPAVILENVVCKSSYSGDRLGCPRSISSWWREIWLERVAPGQGARRMPSSISSH